MTVVKQVGEATIYGDWSDTHEHQFIVIWGESGEAVTVIMLGGYDYGGGVTIASENVPIKEAEAVIKAGGDGYTLYSAMNSLVSLYKGE